MLELPGGWEILAQLQLSVLTLFVCLWGVHKKAFFHTKYLKKFLGTGTPTPHPQWGGRHSLPRPYPQDLTPLAPYPFTRLLPSAPRAPRLHAFGAVSTRPPTAFILIRPLSTTRYFKWKVQNPGYKRYKILLLGRDRAVHWSIFCNPIRPVKFPIRPDPIHRSRVKFWPDRTPPTYACWHQK